MAKPKLGPDAALAELPRKLKHENSMARDLKSLFNDMAEELRLDIETAGIPSNFVNFNGDMEALINKTYRRSSKTFKSEIRNELGLGRTNSTQINREIDNFIKASAPRQRDLIMNTTRKEAQKITNRVIEESALKGETLTNDQLAAKVTKDFKRRNRTRTNTISTTEVQNIAEQSKFTEAEVLKNNNVITTQKRWDATLDRRTRPDHVVADGQRRELDQPFNVGGELLMRPGDRSLGASAHNVINCRCSVQFINVKI